jgi:prepilin-type N-terminal cleavage/methylation domain-containing protein
MKNMNKKLSHCRFTKNSTRLGAGGFTLIELLLAMAVGSIVLAAIFGVYIALNRSYTTQNAAADVQQDLRAGMDFMIEDLMMAGLDPKGTADARIQEARADYIRFTSDRNLNGAVDEADFEIITYSYDSGTDQLSQCLYEGTGSDDWETLLDNVSGFSFSYLDVDGNDLGDPVDANDLNDIQRVVISVTISEPAGRGRQLERTYTTQAHCRNVGL